MAKLPKGANPLYRKLASKSVLGFGKYADMTVSNVLKVDPAWLAYAYYSYDRISFIDEILDFLQVDRIDKPGKRPELSTKWYSKMRRADINDEDNSLSKIKVRYLANQAGKEISREIAKEDPNLRKNVYENKR